jgi:IclR family acetate operon transcriptional repressor
MLAPICHPYLEQLVRQIEETAHLAVREGCQALFVDDVTPNHLILVSGQTGESVPLHCTAHGKALLIDFEQCQFGALFGDAPLSGGTSKSIISIKQLADACAQIRATGFAIDNEEFNKGVRCVAGPIRGVDDAVIASIGISAFSTRFPERRFALAGKQVLAAAQAINSVLKKQAKTL